MRAAIAKGLSCLLMAGVSMAVLLAQVEDPRLVWKLEGRSTPAGALAISPDGQWLATGEGRSWYEPPYTLFKVWNLRTNQTVLPLHSWRVGQAGFYQTKWTMPTC